MPKGKSNSSVKRPASSAARSTVSTRRSPAPKKPASNAKKPTPSVSKKPVKSLPKGNSQKGRTHTREFSPGVKKAEYNKAEGKCRMCGKRCVCRQGNKNYQYAHIYHASQNPDYQRKYSRNDKINDDKYISSENNCILLCKDDHKEIDDNPGKYTPGEVRKYK